MLTRCPNCKSFDVRRSSVRSMDPAEKPNLRSPYRCRDCGVRFWVVSKRAYYLAGLAGLAGVAGALAWNVAGTPHLPNHETKVSVAAAGSFEEALKLAEKKDPVAEYRLAHMYAHGDGVEGNKQTAVEWLERSAEHGNIEAQYELGNALREGSGVVQDYERAAKWLELAGQRGNPDAQYALGQMYRQGMGIPTDNARAYMWFNLAAAQEVPGAAVQRDMVLRLLSAGQVLEAQAEARRLSNLQSTRSVGGR